MRTLSLLSLVFASLSLGQEFKLGSKVSDFQLHDTRGAAASFSQLRGATTVLMFVSTTCPVSNDYNDRMTALFNDYASKGVHFIFVNSNATESAADVDKHAKQVSFPFLPFKDKDNVVADKFGATVTPEAFVIDKTGAIVYHGSIDDSRNAARITVKPLRAALDAVLAAKAVETGETKAFGCTIKRVKKGS
jgi:peroxiredoxin